jgi:hypothetical protein
MPAVAGMVSDIEAELPTGSVFYLVDQEEPAATVRHILEKTYIPVTVVLDTDGNIGATLYTQPRVGLPFSRSYVLDVDTSDFTPVVEDVFTSYDPAAILESINDAL